MAGIIKGSINLTKIPKDKIIKVRKVSIYLIVNYD